MSGAAEPAGLRPIERLILRLVDDGVPEAEIATRFQSEPRTTSSE